MKVGFHRVIYSLYIAQLLFIIKVSKIQYSLFVRIGNFYSERSVVVSTKDFGSFSVGSTPSALTRRFLHCIIIHGMNYFFMVLNY